MYTTGRNLIDTKSKSIIRIHPSDTKRPTHKEVLKYLRDSFPEAYGYAIDMQQRFMKSEVLDAIDCYPDEVLSNRKKELIKRFLLGKCDILSKAINEVVR